MLFLLFEPRRSQRGELGKARVQSIQCVPVRGSINLHPPCHVCWESDVHRVCSGVSDRSLVLLAPVSTKKRQAMILNDGNIYYCYFYCIACIKINDGCLVYQFERAECNINTGNCLTMQSYNNESMGRRTGHEDPRSNPNSLQNQFNTAEEYARQQYLQSHPQTNVFENGIVRGLTDGRNRP